MKRQLCGAALLAALVGCGGGGGGSSKTRTFRALSTFDAKTGIPNAPGEVAEIVAASPDGKTLAYTDATTGQIGFVDISDPAMPRGVAAAKVGGEPTSVTFSRDGRFVLAVVNENSDNGPIAPGPPPPPAPPIFALKVLDATTRLNLRTIELNGQPDSIAVSPDGRFAAVVIENEESPTVPGFLTIVNTQGEPATWTTRDVSLSNLAGATNASDPEPEFADINAANIAAVTLQENNAIALVNLASGSVVRSFSCGTTTHLADLQNNNGASITQTFTGRREPDGIAWTPRGNLVTANEGDTSAPTDPNAPNAVFSGGRNATVFSPTGQVLFETNDLETQIAAAGLYPDNRSQARGVEAEGVDVAQLSGGTYAFIACERANAVAVYRLRDNDRPEFVQVLPTGVSPEGVIAIPSRNLLVTANEVGGSLSLFNAQ